jgi:hypothetical protein
VQEEIYDALVDLKASIDKQNELQEEANGLLRGLIGVLGENAAETEELKDAILKTKT